MNAFFRNLICIPLIGFASSAFAATIEAGRDLEDQDIRALKEWIDTKRQVSLKEIGGDLSISGEVRTEFQSAWETRKGQNQRGSDPFSKLPARGFDVEFNLMLDYRTERTWASVKLEFNDDAGVFSGTLNKIALERAYWGVRALEGDVYTFDIEVGRRSMSSIFDSKVQFRSFFDGIIFRYDHAFENVGDFYIHAGPYIINDWKDHFGYIGEIGLLNIANTGIYTKLALIDWDTKDYSKSFVNNRFRFFISQMILGYRFKIESIRKIGLLYSGFLWNWAAKRVEVSDNQRANWALYFGMSLGQAFKHVLEA